jgi:CheY-like chemotaxis protein
MALSAGNQVLYGLRIFLVDDDAMISVMLMNMLDKLGCEVVGAAATVNQALEMVSTTTTIDVAILDVNIGDKNVFPVADLLLRRDVPCVFSTGYATKLVTERYPLCHFLNKPYILKDLEDVLLSSREGLPLY